MATDGVEEMEWILSPETGIGAYAGGQVFDTGVPDDVELERYTDAKLKPYVIVRDTEPFASTRSRAVGAGEEEQPHVLSLTIVVYGGKSSDVRKVAAAIKTKLLGARPSETSSVLKATGGFSYTQPKTQSSPSRFERGLFFRCFVNL